jgi:glycosyltransferase involved in cell wall biosynthesis
MTASRPATSRNVTSNQPRVAVVLTCYNEGRYVGAAVRSVLQQTRADLVESIVVADDGSGPDTIAVLNDIERWDSRIRILHRAERAGVAAQRNLAIQNTRAPILAILDGDDLWTPDKLELQVPALAADANVGLAYSGYFAFAFDDLGTAFQATVRDICAERDLTRAYFVNDPPIIPSTTLVRRRAFEACGGYDPRVQLFEDTNLYLRLSRICRFAFVDAPLLYKRIRDVSMTAGRKDLIANHAMVAFQAAIEDSRLLPLVPRRLAERARKLGNHRFLLGDPEEAKRLLRFATRLAPFNLRAWASLIVAGYFARPAYRLMASQLRSRRTALGVVEPCR